MGFTPPERPHRDLGEVVRDAGGASAFTEQLYLRVNGPARAWPSVPSRKLRPRDLPIGANLARAIAAAPPG